MIGAQQYISLGSMLGIERVSNADWHALPDTETLKVAATQAFRETVSAYDDSDEVIVHAESDHRRFIYISGRASRQSGSAILIQCRIAKGCQHLWITSLQVSSGIRWNRLARELVTSAETIARTLKFSHVKNKPLDEAKPFWQSLGYSPDPQAAGVMQKKVVTS